MRFSTFALTAALLAPSAHGQTVPTTTGTKTSARQPGGPPTGIAAATLWDHGAGGLLRASSTPELGKLYPLSSEFFVSPSGDVGIGTTAPGARLQVLGTLVTGGGNAADAVDSAVVGGEQNDVLGVDAIRSFVAGGFNNSVSSTAPGSGDSSGVVAGTANSIVDAGRSFVGGGNSNRVDSGAPGILDAFIGGGRANRVSGYAGAVLGGQANVASDSYAVVLGGELNEAAADYAAASGFRAKALHRGSFVRADEQFTDFASTGPNQFLIRAAGGVGIGTTTPGTQLDVAGGVHSSGPAGGAYVAFNPLNQGASVSLSWLNDQARIRIGGNGPGVSNGFEIQRVGNGMIMHVSDAGDVTAKDQMFATGFVQTSDARLKTNVRDVEGALDAVRELRGVRFEWDREQRPEAEEGERLGFLAQEVRDIVPEAVREREDGTLAVAYAELVPVLVEALQEQDRELADLRAELAELRSLITTH